MSKPQATDVLDAMCRNIRPLNNFEPPATRDEATAAALEHVRKVAGTTKPSQANEEAFYAAVKEIAHLTQHLLDDLVTTAPPKDREVEAAEARRARRSGTARDAGPRRDRVEERPSTCSPPRPLVVLTGAGLSTDSGIPDYRGPGAPARAPMTYQEFIATPEARRRYWARSHLGWQRMGRAVPTTGTARSPRSTRCLLITQNVDGLHEAAGSRGLVALHGRVADVICLSCRTTSSRPTWSRCSTSSTPAGSSSTGAACRTPTVTSTSTTPTTSSCRPARAAVRQAATSCSSGRTCPPDRVARCYAAVESLGTERRAAGRRVVADGHERPAVRERAAQAGTPIVIVNRGVTRGDPLASYTLDVGCSEFLVALVGHP